MNDIIYPESLIDRMRSVGKDVSDLRYRQANEQFDAVIPFIKHLQPRVMLDIGCGLGVIDVLFARYFNSIETIHLLDGDGTGERRAGYKIDTVAWNDVSLAVDLVRANVSASIPVIGWQAGEEFPKTDLDLVISCRSWAHHYPASVYMGNVTKRLRNGGHVVTDIRIGQNGEKEFRKSGFVFLQQIPDSSQKCRRWLLRKET